MIVAFGLPRAGLRSGAIVSLCCACVLTGCASGDDPSTSAHPSGGKTPPVRADHLPTDSAAQTAEEIIGRREFASYGVMRDGTVLTVWADGRGYDGEAGVRRAYRLQSPSGQVTTGRLPDGDPEWGTDLSTVTTTAAGFVVPGSPDVILSPDGSFRPFGPGSGVGFEEGDVLVPAMNGRARILRPGTITEHGVMLDRRVTPMAVGGGRLYGFLDPPSSIGRSQPVQVGTSSGHGAWTSHQVGIAFDLRVAAQGRHAAAWVCDEGGHGSGGDEASCGLEGFSVTSDSGTTWRPLNGAERPFEQVDGAVAVDGVLYVDAYPRGFWRSTDDSWTTFAPLDLPERASLHAENGFASAVVSRRKELTILKLGANGRIVRQWIVRIPPGPKPQDPDYGYAGLVSSGDGAVVVRDDQLPPVSRVVDSNGPVSSGRWPPLLGVQEGFLQLNRKDLDASTLLTRTGKTRHTTVASTSDLRPGDSVLTTGRKVPYLFPPTYRSQGLWSFRPSDATFRELPMPRGRRGGQVDGVVDSRGRAWLVQGQSLWHSDDQGASWLKEELPHPAWPNGMEVSGQRVLLMLESPAGDVARILDPEGRWNEVALPSTLPGSGDVWLLSDGRLLIGPVRGRFWRGTSSSNTRYQTIPSGPIAQTAPAGRFLYGIPLGPELNARTPLPLAGDWSRVWVSEDGGSTWREVAHSPTGAVTQ